MRTFLRTTLIALACTFALLTGWYFLLQSPPAKSVRAVSAASIPPQCIPPEISGVLQQEAMNPKAANAPLNPKLKDWEKLAIACATEQASITPAVKERMKESTPAPELPALPTPTIQYGLQNAMVGVENGWSFIPVEDESYQGYNTWIGDVNDHMVRIIGGSMMDSDMDQIPAKHPEWNTTADLHKQSAVEVWINDDRSLRKAYPTQTRNGALHLVNLCNHTLILQAADHTVFFFDIDKLAYVPNPANCPLPAQ